ncbi:helix-turn-helix domain-containing protein [Maribellus comscasis]|uniref:Helix-turn-helix domain-containing protein n=1 Tax=Maribellus comscasis TaxID=2681766 RepID=A0A6I6JLR2_9BACT|nr:Crp/Fnr family transcriptional regulator [Maribellus comscasis]QGY43281.1 helix-turn-helix domain-containing protein [Maribellus comscasis]
MMKGSVKCSCEQCQLKTLFFSHVTVNELTDICEIKEEKTYSKGELIIKEGDRIDEFLYMKEGLVKLSKNSPHEKEQILSFSKPFDFVSLLSIFSADYYRYSVTAVEDSVVCLLDLNVVKNHAQQNAMFTMDLMTRISEATDKIIIENLEIRRKNLKGRVAHVLLYFSNYIYERDEFELPVSRREIAEYIGMTTENVIRSLSEFRKDKIIKIFGKDILIADKKRLKNISEFG